MHRVLAAAALVLSGLVVTAPTPAAAHGQCDGPSDVPILVEYGSLAGAATTVCAPGAAGMRTLDALKSAGLEIEGTTEHGDAIVCRVNGLPDPSAEPCDGMPAADAYWAFYTASEGKPWEYAPTGVAEHVLSEGEFVALAFQEGGESLPTAAADAQLRADAHAPASDASATDDASADAEDDEDGANVGLVVGIIVVLAVIAAGAVVLARRRTTR